MPNALPKEVIRFTAVGDPEVIADSRVRRFKISSSAVARDGHTLATAGWDLANFRANPIVLAVHDNKHIESVIGRAIDLPVKGDDLFADIEFMPRELNPLAEMTLQMVDAGYLRATSVGFIPLDGKPAKGRGQGAFDFSRQELLEISIVPVGSLPDALLAARAAGIDTSPALDWARRIMETADMPEKKDTAANVPGAAAARASNSPTLKRDLYDVSYIAQLLMELAWVQGWVENEAAQEGDGSEVPAQLAEVLKQLGAALVAMTAEEVAELLADHGVEQEVEQDEAQGAIEHMAAGFKRALIGMVRAVAAKSVAKVGARAIAQMDSASIAAALRGNLLSVAGRAALADLIETRDGKVLSADNEAHVRAIADHAQALLDQLPDAGTGDDGDGGETNGDGSEADGDGNIERARARARAQAEIDILKLTKP